MSPSHIASLARRAWQLQRLRTDPAATPLKSYDEVPDALGGLSTGERCAVALLISRPDLLPSGYTVVDAIERMESGGWPVAWLIEAQKLLTRNEENERSTTQSLPLPRRARRRLR